MVNEEILKNMGRKSYEHGGDIYRNRVDIDFSINTNPYGMPDVVRQALIQSINAAGTYPDADYETLREAIADMEQVDCDMIVCGNGASELIYALVRAITDISACSVSNKRDEVCGSVLTPSFSEYKKALQAAGIETIKEVPLCRDNDFRVSITDIDKLFVNTDVVVVGNPNNPTGQLLPDGWINKAIRRAEEDNTYVLLDESFITLTESNCDVRSLSSDKLIRVRSFTKSMAIPGIRIGYAIVHDEEIRSKLKMILPEWNVSVPAVYAGIAAAGVSKIQMNNDGEDGRKKVIDGIRREREYLMEGLQAAGAKIYPSDANFILFEADARLYNELLERGILIRKCGNYEGLNDGFMRVAVRNHQDNCRLVENIKEILETIDSRGEISLASEKKCDGVSSRDTKLMHVKPADIEGESFRILTSELESKGIYLEGDTAPIIKRCIHTTADFEYASSLVFSDGVVEKLKKMIRDGATIITDTNMALSGINKTELAKYGAEAKCFMADADVAKEAKERGVTRATASMEKASQIGKNVIFVVGNAPTALVTLCEMMDNGIYTPEMVIGVPVGFVNVVVAKEMIIDRGIPHIINRGRKGGSNVAAAIVNAILYQMRDE